MTWDEWAESRIVRSETVTTGMGETMRLEYDAAGRMVRVDGGLVEPRGGGMFHVWPKERGGLTMPKLKVTA